MIFYTSDSVTNLYFLIGSHLHKKRIGWKITCNWTCFLVFPLYVQKCVLDYWKSKTAFPWIFAHLKQNGWQLILQVFQIRGHEKNLQERLRTNDRRKLCSGGSCAADGWRWLLRFSELIRNEPSAPNWPSCFRKSALRNAMLNTNAISSHSGPDPLRL